MIVKKTCKNKLTAFINTANRYNHASPVIVIVCCVSNAKMQDGTARGGWVSRSDEARVQQVVATVCCWDSDAVVCLQGGRLDAGS